MPAKTSLSLPVRMCTAAVSGMGAATVCHPLDVVRIRMQLFKTKGFFDTALKITQHQGFGGLYQGIGAAYLRQWTYGSCR